MEKKTQEKKNTNYVPQKYYLIISVHAKSATCVFLSKKKRGLGVCKSVRKYREMRTYFVKILKYLI